MVSGCLATALWPSGGAETEEEGREDLIRRWHLGSLALWVAFALWDYLRYWWRGRALARGTAARMDWTRRGQKLRGRIKGERNDDVLAGSGSVRYLGLDGDEGAVIENCSAGLGEDTYEHLEAILAETPEEMS